MAIIPHLVAMQVAIGVLRAGGVPDQALDVVRLGVGLDGRWALFP